jgi:cytochrome c oxidase subunit III
MSDFTVDRSTEALVPRASSARNAREVAALSARRQGLPIGVWGMAMVVASEVTLFGTFVGSYFYLRFNAAHWPPDGIPRPELLTPLVLAGVLATTAVPMELAARAASAGRLDLVRALVAAALLVQCGYFAYAVHDFQRQLLVFTPSTDAYGSLYYVLLGADHAHVFVGLLLDLWLLGKLATGLTSYRATATRVVALYWYAVIGITLVVTGTLLSAAA